MAKVYLGLGTNLGNKEQNLHSAIGKINNRIGNIISQSGFYETEPWGFTSKNAFLNAVVCVETNMTPLDLLEQTQEIEIEVGRLNKSVNGSYSDRIIDVDLLLYDDLILETDSLILPHPLMAERKFVLEPLTEIAPELVHVSLKKTMKELLAELSLKCKLENQYQTTYCKQQD